MTLIIKIIKEEKNMCQIGSKNHYFMCQNFNINIKSRIKNLKNEKEN